MSHFYKKRHFYALVLPMLIMFIIFMIVPIIINVVYSFTDAHSAFEPQYAGLTNYKRLFQDKYFGYAIRNTFIVCAVLIITIIPTSFFIAYTLNRQTKTNNAIKTIIFAPYIISAALTALIWSFVFNPSTGFINNFLELIGLASWKQAWINGPVLSPYSFAIVGAWAGMGFYVTLWQVGIRSIPTDVLEAGLIDGTTKWQQVRLIMLPMLKDTFGAILVFVITGGLKCFEYVDIMTGGGPLYQSETIVSYMYTSMFTNAQHGYTMTMAVILFIFAMAATIIVKRLTRVEKD